ncbi:MAG: BatD family protein, partial [Bacteroidales bacterium]|nr:BatD family protein [Bacteroidales bacterium]
MRTAKRSSHSKFIALLLSIYFGMSLVSYAQDKTFKASAPAVVNAGTAFNYAVSGDTQGDVSFSPPSGVRILGGPSSMTSFRSSNINGRMETVREVSYTYVLIADKEGEYVIPPAVIKSGRKEFQSNEVRFKAVGSTASTSEGASAGEPASVMVQLIPSKRTIYEGEQIVLSTKVLVREQLQITALNSASYEGFWAETLEPDDFAMNETVDGQNYRTQVIKRDLLTAQKKGEVTIGPSIMDVTIQKRVRSRNNVLNDPFFDNAFSSYENVPQSVKSNTLTLNIKPLPPNAPESFKGAVGNFKITSSLSKDSVQTNDAISLIIKYSGKGNLDLIRAPELDLPPDLEVFEPKRVANLKHELSGTSGSLSFEYVLIPRHAGNYRISPINISFFNPNTTRYDRYISDPFEFVVTGDNAGN